MHTTSKKTAEAFHGRRPAPEAVPAGRPTNPSPPTAGILKRDPKTKPAVAPAGGSGGDVTVRGQGCKEVTLEEKVEEVVVVEEETAAQERW